MSSEAQEDYLHQYLEQIRQNPQLSTTPPRGFKAVEQYEQVAVFDTGTHQKLYFTASQDFKSSYGRLKPLLSDDQLEEVMYLGPQKCVMVYHRKHGMCNSNIFLPDEEAVGILKRIAKFVGKVMDKENPLLDGRLPDGSRVNGTVKPASPDGASITIRKFRKDPLTITDLIKFGTIDAHAAAFLWTAIEGLQYKPANVLVSGGTGSGKTTTLNILAMFIPSELRVLSIEDTAELQFEHDHWLRLESVPPAPGIKEIAIDDLLKNTLRMRPDRIIVGEVRGPEAKTMFTAMNTGHSGTLGTVHANTAQETVTRLTSPPMEVSPVMLKALDLIVMQNRMTIKGKPARRIVEIAEVGGMEKDRPRLNVIYKWDGVAYRLKPTGNPSKLRENISKEAGITFQEFDVIIRNREQVLDYLVSNGYRDKEMVSRVIQNYYLKVRKHTGERKLLDSYGSVDIVHDGAKNMTYYLLKSYAGGDPMYGKLAPLLADDQLEEIMYNDDKHAVMIYHRKHDMCTTNVNIPKEEISALIKMLGNFVGKIVDAKHPILDGRLPDGSRVNATMPPASPDAPTLTIRKFRKDPLTIIDLVNFKTMDTKVASQIWTWIEGIGQKPSNVIIAGGTSCGKTTTLNIFAMFFPLSNRILTIEDTLELQLKHEHWVRMESIPPDMVTGKGQVSMDDLLKNTLRMRPDRILVGEVRGPEAKTMFTAMNTGHDGSLGTVHANSAQETVTRLTSPPMEVPVIMMTGLDLIIMQQRMTINGKAVRRITEIAEIGGMEKGLPRLNIIFKWDPASDTIKETDVPSKLREKICKVAGISAGQYNDIVRTRKDILDYMVKSGKSDVDYVYNTIQNYYTKFYATLKGK